MSKYRKQRISTEHNDGDRYLCSSPDDINMLGGDAALGGKEAQDDLALLDDLTVTQPV